jgi:hypothetical protein
LKHPEFWQTERHPLVRLSENMMICGTDPAPSPTSASKNSRPSLESLGLPFIKKILAIGLEFAKKNPIQSDAIVGSTAHTHHHMKKLPSPSSRDVWEIFSVSSAQSPFSLVDR